MRDGGRGKNRRMMKRGVEFIIKRDRLEREIKVEGLAKEDGKGSSCGCRKTLQ